MTGSNRASWWRCLLVAAGTTAGLLALAGALVPDLAEARDALVGGRLGATPFADLLEWWCAACALALAAWLWGGTVVVAATAGSAARWAPAPLPAPLRRLVLLACGVVLTGGLTLPAQAAPGDASPERGAATTAALLDGLPLPDRPTGAGAPPAAVARPAPVHRVATVVVRPGDTLWDLARDALPGATTDPAVARRWRRIYALNRRTVGPDPDLIRPGERLRLPHP